MHDLYCSVCGAKLPELDVSGSFKGALCKKCAAARGDSSVHAKTSEPSSATPVQVTPAGAMGFYFCEKCGKRVTNADLARGQGRDKQLKGVFCAACSDGTMTVAFDAISQEEVWKEEQKRRQKQRRSTSTHLPTSRTEGAEHQQPHAPSTPPRLPKNMIAFVAAGFIAAVVTAVGALLFFGGGKSAPPDLVESKGPIAPPVAQRVPSAPREPSSNSTSEQGKSPAAQQLERIRALVTPDLKAYAEIRTLLEQFPRDHAGTPEVEKARTLRTEVETAREKLAEEALSAALAAVRVSSSDGTFDEAESKLRGVESRFGDGAWFTSKGKDAIAEARAEITRQRMALEAKKAAVTLEKARAEFRNGRLTAAGKLIAERDTWPAEIRTQANALAADIERKATEAAAARKLAAERAAILAEFDERMKSGRYAEAREYAKSKADAGGPVAEVLRAGERLAGSLKEEPEAILRGARKLMGREVRLKLTEGEQNAIVKTVSDSGLGIAITYKINNETMEKPGEVKWEKLSRQQKAEFARLGGFELSRTDIAIVSAYASLASNDLAAAEKSAGGTGTDPLGVHLVEFVQAQLKQQAYETAMGRAKELLAAGKLKGAVGACNEALAVKPDEEEATSLLAELDRRLTAQPTLTLDLGNDVKMEFVYIKPGTFVMGGECTTEGRFEAVEVPKHTVTITKGFYLAKYEVTQAQYQAIMGKNPSRSNKDPNGPVDSTQWNDEHEFCKRVSEKAGQKIRLPTEAEWEYACRAGTETDWSSGSDPALLVEYAWIASNSGGKSHPVGEKKANPWGLYDMHGNVCERVADFYQRDYYASSPKEDPRGAEGRFANGGNGTTILRGGTWKSGAKDCKAGARLRGGGYGVYENWGFRAAITPNNDSDTDPSVTDQER